MSGRAAVGLLRSGVRSWIAWLCVVLILIFVWLFRGNGFYQIASIVFFTNGTYLVGPPQAYHDLCEQYAGAEVFRTVEGVGGIAYFPGVLLQARENELELQPVVIDENLLATGTSDTGNVLMSRVSYSTVARLLESYQYIDSYAEPQTNTISFVGDAGFYKFSRLDLPRHRDECARIESEYVFRAREDANALRATGLMPPDFCIRSEPIEKIGALYEYIEAQQTFAVLTYKTLISDGAIDVRRSVARNRVSGQVFASSMSFHWHDSVGGGSRESGLHCHGEKRFPSPQKVYLPLRGQSKS